jgi:outer membrane protein assembly factor BamB
MKNFKNISLLILIITTSFLSFGQGTVTFPKTINSMKMTATGVAIVATDDALYGIDKTGKKLWEKVKLKKIDANRIEILEGSELILVQGGLMQGIKVINVLNGNLIGSNDGPIYGARVIHGTNQVWIIKQYNAIDVWDISSNTKLYRFDKVSLPYGLTSSNQTASQPKNFIGVQPITYTSNKSAILHLGVGQLGEYDLNTGNPIWEFDWKPYKVKKPKDGKGDLPSIPGKGFAIMKLDPESNTLYFPFRNMLIAVDSKTGKAKWDVKANKISKVKDIFIINEGIVVRTLSGIELVDKNTGNLKWNKPIKIKGSDGGLLINNKGTFYIVSKGSIEKIDIANKKSIPLTEKIKFKGGESFTSLELINNLAVLSSSQNMIGVNKESGKILYQVYYKAPGPSLLDVAGNVAGNVALAGVAMASTYNSMKVNAQAGNRTYYQYTPAMRNSGGSNSSKAGNNLFISTKFNDDDAQGFGIAKVNKESGKTTKKFVIGSRSPVYVVDENNGMIFYKSEKKVLTIKSVI